MGIALGLVLVAFVGAHLVLVVGLGRRRRFGGGAPKRPLEAWVRSALALVVAPLAPWWGWQAGLRLATIAWSAALLLYAVGVAVTGR